ALEAPVDGDGTDLGDVVPQHVQGPAPGDHRLAVGLVGDLRDDELADVLEVADEVLLDEAALGGVGRHEVVDPAHVPGQRRAHDHLRAPAAPVTPTDAAHPSIVAPTGVPVAL